MYYKWNFLVNLASLLAIIFSTSVHADTERPSAVANVTASSSSSSSIAVSWSTADDNVGVDGYNLYRDGGYYTTVFGTRSFTDTNVDSGRYYRYTVVAFDKARNYSTQSTSATASTSGSSSGDDSGGTPLTSGRPAAPDALRGQVRSGSSVDLTWNAPSGGAEGYNVYRDDSYFATVRDRSQYTVSSLDSNREYSFYVVAFRNNQFSTRSTSIIVRTGSTSSNETASPPPQASNNNAAPPPPQASGESGSSTASVEKQPIVNETSTNSSPAVAAAVQTSQRQDIPVQSTIGKSASFASIRANGLDNACYFDAEHFVAEFLYQNPDVCFWAVDEANGMVSEVPVPEIPADAISLPSPTGRDDTGMLEALINSSSGKTYVGSGVYKVKDLRISKPVTIHNMPMEPHQNAFLVVSVRSADVRIFNSPIDGSASSNTNIGFDVVDGSDRFVLVNSGFSNVRGATNRNTAGVLLRGVDDFHLACNTFENIVNRSSRAGVTSRANAIWMSGGGSGSSTSGGVIANNYSENLQSSGSLKDAEFFTAQGYRERGNDEPVRIFANRAVNAGKRMSKHQNSGALLYSNSYDWQDSRGELGKRQMFAMVGIQRANDVAVRNNRFMAGANSQFDHIFTTDTKSSGLVQDNLHFDCNSIEIREKLTSQSGAAPRIINARAVPNSSGNFEATNSSAKNNVVFGNGNVKHFYSFGAGYDRFGGRFDTRGNQFSIPYTGSQHATH